MLRVIFFFLLYVALLGGFLSGILLIWASTKTKKTEDNGPEEMEAKPQEPTPVPEPNTPKHQILSEKPSWITFNCGLDGENEEEKVRELREKEDASYEIIKQIREEKRRKMLLEYADDLPVTEPAVTISELSEEADSLEEDAMDDLEENPNFDLEAELESQLQDLDPEQAKQEHEALQNELQNELGDLL